MYIGHHLYSVPYLSPVVFRSKKLMLQKRTFFAKEGGYGGAPRTLSACGACDHTLALRIRTDQYPSESYFSLESSDDTCVGASSGPSFALNAYTTYYGDISTSLCAGMDYTFTVYDSYGDGLCCGTCSTLPSNRRGEKTLHPRVPKILFCRFVSKILTCFFLGCHFWLP